MANYPWASSSVFEYRTPCCECSAGECYLNIPINAEAYYADETEAQAALDNQSTDCHVFSIQETGQTVTLDAITGGYEVDAQSDSQDNPLIVVGMFLAAGTFSVTLSANVTGGTDCDPFASAILYKIVDGEITDTIGSVTAIGLWEIEITEAGNYMLYITGGGTCGMGGGGVTCCPPLGPEGDSLCVPPDVCMSWQSAETEGSSTSCGVTAAFTHPETITLCTLRAKYYEGEEPALLVCASA